MSKQRRLLGVLGACLAMAAISGCEMDVPESNSGGTGGSAGAQGGSAGNASGGTPSTAGNTASGGSSMSGGSGGTAAGAGGTGGSSGSGGGGGSSAGAAGAAGSSGGSGGAPSKSAGCGMPAGQDLETWVERPIDVDGTQRDSWVMLPANYDPDRAYPVVFLFHGCSSITNNVPVWDESGDNAIFMRGAGVSPNTCWDAGGNSDDLAFFDEMVASISSSACVDSSRLFAAGYSSGSWLINRLACARGNVLRAAGTVSGGNPGNNNCVDSTLARIFIHDLDDPEPNPIEGQETERDRVLGLNGCDDTLPRVPEDPAPCERYQGCDPGFPVVWCATSGQMHDRQDDLAAPAFWNFFLEF